MVSNKLVYVILTESTTPITTTASTTTTTTSTEGNSRNSSNFLPLNFLTFSLSKCGLCKELLDQKLGESTINSKQTFP